MRILYVVQRYGREVAGGAELACRQFATHLAECGHDVEVVTTCATSYVDWADVYDPGTSDLDGVTVHRLSVHQPRQDRVFGPLNTRTVWSDSPVALHLQREWMRIQGPNVPDLAPWLVEHVSDYDVIVFFTYLYNTTWAGLKVAAPRAVTVLHPTAHDEPPLYLPIFDQMFRLPSAFAFFTEEEAGLVTRRFGITPLHDVIGIGIDLDLPATPDAFRAAFGVHDPYLVFVGRLDPGKGSDELFDFFATYKRRNPGPLKLVLVGDPVRPVPPHPDVVPTGFVDVEMRRAAVAGATALVQPSYFESFSMVLTEAWALSRPALVQSHCDVLRGQAKRSGGGLPYRGFAEFEAAVDLLLADPGLGRDLGAAGRSYVESRYSWSAVMDRYQELLLYVRWRSLL